MEKNSSHTCLDKQKSMVPTNEIRKDNSRLSLLLKTSAELIQSTDTHLCLRMMIDAIKECGWNKVVLAANVEGKDVQPEDVITIGITENAKESWISNLSSSSWKQNFEKARALSKIGEFYLISTEKTCAKENNVRNFVKNVSFLEESDAWHAPDWLCSPLRLSNGQVVGGLHLSDPADGKLPSIESLVPIELFIHIATAVIEKDLLNQQLLEGEKLFRLLAENAQDVIFRVQIKPELKVEFVSQSVSMISGYTPKEFAADPMSFLKIIHPNDAPALMAAFTNHSDAKGPIVQRWIRTDGSTAWIELTTRFVYDENGQVVSVEGIARDITERKKMNDQLKDYAQRLEEMVDERTRRLRETQEKLLTAERLVAIGQLAGMIGHDLRNPLTRIMGCMYYLEKNLDKHANGKMQEMIVLIRKNVTYSNKIINDLTDYSRELVLELNENNPKIIIKEALAAVDIPESIQLVNLAKNRPKMSIDPQKITRTFVSIIKNAIDAMPERGTLKIESIKVGDRVIFSFSDTGTGIEEEVMKKLGTPLFTTKAKGMGFGLAISKRIVEAHGGLISVTSNVGKGTSLCYASHCTQNKRRR
jgi:PAS domain S-box-containing protein